MPPTVFFASDDLLFPDRFTLQFAERYKLIDLIGEDL